MMAYWTRETDLGLEIVNIKKLRPRVNCELQINDKYFYVLHLPLLHSEKILH